MEYKASGEAVAKMEVQFNRDEQVLRYLTIRLDKFSVDYNERKRRGEIGRIANRQRPLKTHNHGTE